MSMNKSVPKATLQRYPVYLKALRNLSSKGITKIMSKELSEHVDIESTTIRRDFSFLGSLGKQGYGYDVNKLIEKFNAELGIGFDEKIIIVGCGNLGKALMKYNRWNHVAGEIICGFDMYPEDVGETAIPVYGMDELQEKLPEGCRIAILCISKDVQNTVNLLIDSGITGFVSFTHQHFQVPKHVSLRLVDVISTVQEIVFETNSISK